MTDKKEAIEKATNLLRMQFCAGHGLIDAKTAIILSDFWDTALQGRDEVIEECANIAYESIMAQTDMMAVAVTVKTLIRQLKSEQPKEK